MNDEKPTTESETPPDFPTAKLEPRNRPARKVLGSSRMWWATLAAVLVAGLLVWRSIEPTGPHITIQFPDGHGLRVGDFVRHRGIDVGHIDRIDLSDDLTNIEVAVTLFHGAEGLAREGTRFWIVRPQLSLTEVRGLETAVGAKYVAVSPGSISGERCFTFVGLAAPPPGDLDDRGMEVVLRGEDSFGLYVRAPIAWRGVDVGEVLSVNLAADTRYVDVRVRINSAYGNLVRSNSRFWATSGLGIDAGLTGFTLKAESLTTIARGGVSFITPADAAADRVRSGHVFTLHGEEEAVWTEEASTVSLIDFPLPPTATLRGTWKEKSFGFTRSRERNTTALVVGQRDGTTVTVFAPAEVFASPDGALDDSWALRLVRGGADEDVVPLPDEVAIDSSWAGIARCDIELTPMLSPLLVGREKLRVAAMPEDCCLVRSVAGGEGASSVMHPLSQTALSPLGPTWRVDPGGSDLDDWHGAAVVAASDGAVIGMFLATAAGPVIAPIQE